MTGESVHVIGASGRSGAALSRSLLSDGVSLVPVVRDAARWSALGLQAAPLIADIADAGRLRSSAGRRDMHCFVCPCAARRSHSGCGTGGLAFRVAGQHAQIHPLAGRSWHRRIAGEAAFLTSRRCGVMLHPTMIYGAEGEDNVRRLAALLRRLPVVPLPAGAGLVQPIHQDDVTRASVRRSTTTGTNQFHW